VRIEKIENYTKLSVIDKGNGTPPDSIDKIFDRYYRVDEHTTRASGLGLGLNICASIIRQHGGEIGVESEPGKGASFWFTIPDNPNLKHYVQ
jgi:signal transduction histidine kinase